MECAMNDRNPSYLSAVFGIFTKNNSMSKRLVYIGIAIITCIAILSGGCKKSCGTCRSYGYNTSVQLYTAQACVNNVCTCPNGFEGDSCQIYSVNKYIQPSSNWQVSDPCSGYPTYNVYTSTNYPYYTYFYITGLFNSGAQTTVNIQSGPNNQGTGNVLYIQSQQVGGVATISGYGTYQLNGTLGKITLYLDYNQGGVDQPSCVITMYQIQ
jgi:hypothetical protein